MSLTGQSLSDSGRRRTAPKLGILACAGLVLAVCVAVGMMPAQAKPVSDAQVGLATLPPEARSTYQRVLNGGPFAYSKDGIVFRNRERRLPVKSSAYYHEYTVQTPGSRDRGARRIVCGGKPPAPPEACFYTDDHYASFRRIVQ